MTRPEDLATGSEVSLLEARGTGSLFSATASVVTDGWMASAQAHDLTTGWTMLRVRRSTLRCARSSHVRFLYVSCQQKQRPTGKGQVARPCISTSTTEASRRTCPRRKRHSKRQETRSRQVEAENHANWSAAKARAHACLERRHVMSHKKGSL